MPGWETTLAQHNGYRPRVVIAGRPNVGKSTLFNRLYGRRRAITDPTPGVTRDAIEEDCSLAGIPVALVDTGGDKETTAMKTAAPKPRRWQPPECPSCKNLPGREPGVTYVRVSKTLQFPTRTKRYLKCDFCGNTWTNVQAKVQPDS